VIRLARFAAGAAIAALVAAGGLAAASAAASDPAPSVEIAGVPASTPAPRSATAPVTARSISVDDGDSFVARRADGTKFRVRLAGIDAPEKSQPWANAARQKLRGLLHERELVITALKTDRWGRLVALVAADGEDPALAMLEAGLAWHFTRYDRDLPVALRERYAQAEAEARSARLGLWQANETEAPWEFRRRQR
jgi:endonuclease YncB( thermonuclease family)